MKNLKQTASFLVLGIMGLAQSAQAEGMDAKYAFEQSVCRVVDESGAFIGQFVFTDDAYANMLEQGKLSTEAVAVDWPGHRAIYEREVLANLNKSEEKVEVSLEEISNRFLPYYLQLTVKTKSDSNYPVRGLGAFIPRTILSVRIEGKTICQDKILAAFKDVKKLGQASSGSNLHPEWEDVLGAIYMMNGKAHREANR